MGLNQQGKAGAFNAWNNFAAMGAKGYIAAYGAMRITWNSYI